MSALGPTMASLPVTENAPYRPVYERALCRHEGRPLEFPTEAEQIDAMQILKGQRGQTHWDPSWPVSVVLTEALRIVDEVGR